MSEVRHKYVPRKQFAGFHSRHQRWTLIVAHRRAGKTVAVVNDLIVRALRTQKRNAFYAYIGPYFGQAKQTAWPYIKEAVREIPGVKVSESESSIVLPNGSKIRIFGADNADALRGLYFDGVVCDEFGEWAGRVWTEVIRPALADRKGFAIFIGTPRGKNKFYELYQRAIAQPEAWYYTEVKASESEILSEEELAAIREDLDDDEYAQEMECSWTATIRGSYYGKNITELEARGAIRQIGLNESFYDPTEPVCVAHDPGRDDAWAMWFWQVINGEVRFIDYWEESGYDAEEIIAVLENKPYSYETWWVPHDALHKTARSKLSILDVFVQNDAPARKVPNPDAGTGTLNGVKAVRNVLRTFPVAFDAIRCARGLEALKNYSRKWNADTKVFRETPNHDQWSHGADAFRYACLSLGGHEAIQRSLERAATKASKKAAYIASGQLNSDTSVAQTFNDAIQAHQRRLAAQRSEGRTRV